MFEKLKRKDVYGIDKKDYGTDRDPYRYERCGYCQAVIGKDYGSFYHKCAQMEKAERERWKKEKARKKRHACKECNVREWERGRYRLDETCQVCRLSRELEKARSYVEDIPRLEAELVEAFRHAKAV